MVNDFVAFAWSADAGTFEDGKISGDVTTTQCTYRATGKRSLIE